VAATSGFEDIDRAPEPAALLAYLDTASALQMVRDYKRQSFALLDLSLTGYVVAGRKPPAPAAAARG
jgi:hypothetical protein